MTRVLILYASIGSGHFTAARSIRAALMAGDKQAQVELVDVFGEHLGYKGTHDLLSGLMILALPRLYDWSWRTGALRGGFAISRRLPWLRGRVRYAIRHFKPDVIVSTHALPCAIAVAEGGLTANLPQLAVATDFEVHPYWPVQAMRAFVVAGEAGRATLLRRGAAEERVHTLGIPIRADLPAANQPQESPDLHVLVIAGGGRSGPYLSLRSRISGLLDRLAQCPLPGLRWTFIFGSQAGLQRRAEHLLAGRRDVTLYGFVPDLPCHLAAADLVVTKPGGLTLAETCALGKPVLLLSKGAGQEAANARVMISSGTGQLADTPAGILAHVVGLAHDRDQLARMSACSRELGKPQAATQIAALICSLVGETGL